MAADEPGLPGTRDQRPQILDTVAAWRLPTTPPFCWTGCPDDIDPPGCFGGAPTGLHRLLADRPSPISPKSTPPVPRRQDRRVHSRPLGSSPPQGIRRMTVLGGAVRMLAGVTDVRR